MPKFTYSVALIATLAWIILINYLVKVPPETNILIFFAVFLFFIAFNLTLALAIFFFRYRKTPKFHREDPKIMFRTVFKKTTLLTVLISLALLVKMLI